MIKEINVSAEERRRLMRKARGDLNRRSDMRGCLWGLLIGFVLWLVWMSINPN